MRGSKAKVLRSFAKAIAFDDGLPLVTYKTKNEQIKFYQNPMMKEPVEYPTATVYLGESRRAIYRKLKRNLKVKN
jgi:hypothetical protein